ncbi:hypothetical protein CC80DRAFT_164813 [Byssothecium circinans]|uniref:Uncharacterized protein n=1 Tax=Byssothecium circinans TaxID=147558 RepID=A0A6A5TLE2_9PLEO|nr:hypothetical protein CC80DRAFT_164813 [Byssothecium circinans]
MPKPCICICKHSPQTYPLGADTSAITNVGVKPCQYRILCYLELPLSVPCFRWSINSCYIQYAAMPGPSHSSQIFRPPIFSATSETYAPIFLPRHCAVQEALRQQAHSSLPRCTTPPVPHTHGGHRFEVHQADSLKSRSPDGVLHRCITAVNWLRSPKVGTDGDTG